MKTQSMPSSKTNRTAFTLIELLTVIAIIGILAAILIPVVGAAREAARKVKCLSNMRQVGVAILTYETENGVLPGPSYRRVRRPVAINPDYREINWTIDDYVGAKRSEIYDCPTNAIVYSKEQNQGNVAFLLNNTSGRTNPPRFFGYPGAGPVALSPDQVVPAANNGRPKNLEQIISAGTTSDGLKYTELSQIWMISDVDGGNYSAASIGTTTPQSVPMEGEFRYVHEGGRNYVFFDGHAEFRREEDFPYYGYPIP